MIRLPRLSLSALQPLGRALMLPIAVLPAASLMLRLGQPDLAFLPGLALAGPLLGAAGDAIFSNLGILFAIGVAVGLARGGDGAAGLAGAVCFLVATQGAQALIAVPPDAVAGLAGKGKDLATAAFKAAALAKLGVPIGILSGLIGGGAFNRFGAIKLPDYLAFFGGRRFAPIISGFAGLALALIFGLGWAGVNQGMDAFSRAILTAGPAGLFLYGVLNRLLIVTGLHHILNNIAWFILGDFHGATGDLKRFFAGDPSAGAFMSGFFPVMMFGLPAACLAMYHAAPPERRKAVGGMLLSLALTALLTGVTEPIEFSFMFLAPALYGLHAVLTGVSMVVMDALHVRLGFGFSAGLFDYLLNFQKAQRPLLLIPVGAVYFAIYYGVFRVVIARFNLMTPGREPEMLATAAAGPIVPRAEGFIAALGGAGNLTAVEACTTRLRLQLIDQARVDEPALKALGSRGLVRPSPKDLQVVLGPHADDVAREMRDALALAPQARGGPSPAAPPPVQAAGPPASEVLAALGGAANVLEVDAASSRIRVVLRQAAGLDEAKLRALGVRALAHTASGAIHLIVGPVAGSLGAGLRTIIGRA
ncbi:N-acetylglucosamine-specific PTS transporter subunit IIBC [Phenylobacterium sp.]|uniref:N-acetylglucosamine-specific PTS transporter subunit IIBC n=1 Tax=Phenylobacterium sp. TaxID=1871053 RepID=UPI002DE9E751|nr:N-acetylglucosamine-specific PTS transporter subunit IIBC [Phenylobacterium sp.]